MGWRDDVICPGRDFSLKKIPANDLREMVQAYVDGDRTRNTTFTVEKWTEGVFCLFLFFSFQSADVQTYRAAGAFTERP